LQPAHARTVGTGSSTSFADLGYRKIDHLAFHFSDHLADR
jgi:hypothetical protein